MSLVQKTINITMQYKYNYEYYYIKLKITESVVVSLNPSIYKARTLKKHEVSLIKNECVWTANYLAKYIC